MPVLRQLGAGRAAPAAPAARPAVRSEVEPLEVRAMLSGNFPAGSDNAIAYDLSGNLHVAYYDAAAHNLKYVRQAPGGQFSEPITIDGSSADVGRFVSLAIDAAGRPGIAYQDVANADLKYAHFDGANWTVGVVEAKGNVGTNPSLVYDPKNVPNISYYKTTGGDLRLATLGKKNKWSIKTVASKGNVGQHSSLAIDPKTGKPVVAFEDTSGKIQFVQKKSGSTFSKPVVVDKLAGPGGDVSLAFGPDGKPVFSYFDPNSGAIKLAGGDAKGKKFTTQTVATVPPGSEANQMLVVNPQTGARTIVFYDKANDGVFTAMVMSPTSTPELTQIKTGGEGTTAAFQPANGSISFTTLDTSNGGTPQLVINNTATTPLPPTDVTATASTVVSDTVTITWTDASDNETGFMIERSADGEHFATIAFPAVDSNSYTDTGLTEGTTYYYRVSATGGDGTVSAGRSGPRVEGGRPSVTGGVNTVAVATTLTAAPTNVAATANSATEVRVSWVDASAHETGYRVERSNDNGATWAAVAVTAPDATEYADATAAEGRSYQYRVSSFNVTGSAPGNVASVVTPPAAPSNVTVSRFGSSQLDVHWNDNSATETGFVVERSIDGTSFSVLATLAAGTTSYSDGGLGDATVYYYRVKAVGAGGPSAYSATANGTTDPVAPSNLTAVAASTSRIDLTWVDNATGEGGFIVQRQTTGGAYVTVATLPADTTSYSDTGRAEGTSYTYRVRATAAPGGSDSAYSAAVTTFTLPAAPSNLTAALNETNGVSLTWSDNSGGETGYQVQRSPDGGTTWTTVGTLSANVNAYTDASAAEGKPYDYRVRASNSSGFSTASNTASVTTRPAAPTALTAAGTTSTSVTLNWTDNSTGETGFKVERSANGVDFTQVGTTSANTTTYVDGTGLAGGTSYTYRVRATNAGGDSAYTNAAATVTRPVAPTTVTATPASTTRVDLSWSAVTGATGYRVERSINAGISYAPVAGTSSQSATTLSDLAADEGTDYLYRVVATNASGDSVPSTSAAATTFPNAALDVEASATSATSVHVTWTDNSDGEDAYEIYRSTGGGTPAKVGTVDSDEEAFDDTTATEGTAYSYTVRAVNAGGFSDSAPATVTTKPAAPTGVTSIADAGTGSVATVRVSWTNRSATATSFRVERSTGGGSFATVGMPVSASPFTDTTAAANTVYAYRVVAIGPGGESAASTASADLTTPPAATAFLSASATSDTSVTLTFNAVAGATGYKVERADAPTSDVLPQFFQIGTADFDDTSYVDAGATEASSYVYRIRTVGTGGDSPYSATATATTRPAAASDLTLVTVTDTTATLTWVDNSHGETAYRVERAPAGSSTFAEVARAAAGETSADAPVTEGGDFVFRVVAEGAVGDAAPSDPVDVAASPATPTGLQAEPQPDGTVVLSWTDHSDHETGFLVQRIGLDDESISLFTINGADNTTYTDTAAGEAQAYLYRVKAVQDVGRTSGFSDQATITTVPAAPTGLTATFLSDQTVELAWTDNSDGETGYRIERSTAGGDFDLIDTADADSETYVDTTTAAGTSYTYRVRATNAGGDSLPSNTYDASTAPAVPQHLHGTVDADLHVVLTWDDVAAETGYVIERSDNGADFAPLFSPDADETTYTDTGTQELHTYQYRIRAENAAGASADSDPITVNTYLATPANLTAEATGPTTVALTWDDTSGSESGFVIERSVNGGPFTPLDQVDADTTAYTDETAAEGTVYGYHIIATGPLGDSQPSDPAGAATPLYAATDLTAEAISTGEIDLNWTDNSGAETGYVVYRSTAGGPFVNYDSTGPGASSYVDLGVSEGTDYAYKVVAVGTVSSSAESDPAAATTYAAAPTNLTATPASDSSISLAWEDNSDGESGYKVFRAVDGGEFDLIDTIDADETTYADGGLDEATLYTYQVVAVNDAGDSDPSNPASAATKPAAPSDLAAVSDSDSSVTLTWVDNSLHAQGFLIERSEGPDGSPAAADFQPLTTVGPTPTTFTDTGLTEGTVYHYRVSAYADETSDPSDAADVTTRPAAPDLTYASEDSPGTVSLEWDDNSNGETAYLIQRATGAGSFATIHQVGPGVTSYDDSSVAEATTYSYQIVATNDGGDSDASGPQSLLTLPDGPTNVDAESTTGTDVSVTWDDNSQGETGYRVERSDGGAAFHTVGTTDPGETTFDDEGVMPASHYAYRVYAVNTAGESDPTQSADVLTRPGVVTGTSAAATSDSEVTVAWGAVNGAESYVVERSDHGGAFAVVFTTPDAATLEFDDTGLSESTTYTYRVSAANASGPGTASGPTVARTLPTAPTDLIGGSNGGTEVDLLWTDASDSATSYRVERSTGGAFVTVATLMDGDADAYEDTTVAGGTDYTYRVVANDGTADSPLTSTVDVTTVPEAPANFAAVASSASVVELSWDDSHGATEYRLERSLDGSDFDPVDVTSANTYEDTGLDEATHYVYRITPVGDAGDGDTATAATDTLPAAPAGLTVTGTTDTTVSLSWTDVSTGEDGYVLERSTDGDDWTPVAGSPLAAGTHTFTDTGLTEATAYAYRLTAHGTGGSSTAVEEEAVTRPAAPSDLTAEAASNTTVDLSWTDNSAGETGFTVLRSSDGVHWDTVTSSVPPHVGPVGAGAPGSPVVGTPPAVTYSDTTAEGGTEYQYLVVANGLGGDSAPSDPATATTYPDAVEDLQVTAVSATEVDLTWGDVDGETGYTIQRSVAGAAFSDYDTADADETAYSDTEAPEGSVVAYRVYAVNATGVSADGNEAMVTTVPAGPTSLTANDTSATTIALAWDDGSDHETHFIVERSNDHGGFDLLATLDPDEVSYEDTVDPGSTFTYHVYATGPGGDSLSTADVSATTVPAGVSNLTAVATDDTHVTVTWDDVPGETGYKIRRSDDGGDNWTDLDLALPANTHEYDDAAAAEATDYLYEVTAFNASGDGAPVTTPVGTPPTAATGLHQTSATSTTITLAWTDHSNGESGFVLRRAPHGTTTWTTVSSAIAPNTLTFTDTSLAAATEYDYELTASNGPVQSAATTATGLTTPAAVTDLTFDVTGTTTVDLNWTDTAGETGYRVLRSVEGGTFTQVGSDLDADETTFTDTTAGPSTNNVYRVVPFNTSGDGATADTGTALTVPTAPTGVTATPVSAGRVDVTWVSTLDHLTEFDVYRSTGGGAPTLVFGADPADRGFSDHDVDGGTEYTYTVRAVNATDESVDSDPATALTYPDQVQNLTPTVFSASEIDLAWDVVSGADGYRVYRSDAGGNFAQVGADITDGSHAFADTGLDPASQYAYEVVAFNDTGEGQAAATGTLVTKPAAPQNVTAAAVAHTTNKIDLSWDAVTGATQGYTIERSTNGGMSFSFLAHVIAGDGTTYTDTGLSSGTRYVYHVYATNVGGNSANSADATAYTYADAPTNLAAAATGPTTADVTWTDVTGETSYVLYRAIHGSGSFTSVATPAANATVVHETGLTESTTYDYKIVAVDPAGNSEESDVATVQTYADAPTGVTASPLSAAAVDVSWTSTSAGLTGFKVYRDDGDGDGYVFLADVDAADRTYHDTGLSAATTYGYKVTAVNTAGESAQSTADSALTYPDAPANVTAIASSTTAIDVDWDAVTGADGYRVYRQVDGAGGFTQVGTDITDGSTDYTDGSATAGHNYVYRVTAFNDSGEGQPTASASVVTLPDVPQNVVANPVSAAEVDVSWDAVTGATGYVLQRAVGGGSFADVVDYDGTSTSYVDTDVDGATLYEYQVRATNASGTSTYSDVASATTVPNAPANVAAGPTSDTETHVTWDATPGATGYKVLRDDGDGNGFHQVATPATNSFDDSGLAEGTLYVYKVVAVNGTGDSAASGTASATTLPTAPDTLVATAFSETEIDLTWVDHSDTETSYEVDRSVEGGPFTSLATGLPVDTEAFDDETAITGTNYDYKVFAVGPGGRSAESNTANATTP